MADKETEKELPEIVEDADLELEDAPGDKESDVAKLEDDEVDKSDEKEQKTDG